MKSRLLTCVDMMRSMLNKQSDHPFHSLINRLNLMSYALVSFVRVDLYASGRRSVAFGLVLFEIERKSFDQTYKNVYVLDRALVE